MWSVIPHITTSITLIAFLAAVAAWVYRASLKHKERLIRTAPERRTCGIGRASPSKALVKGLAKELDIDESFLSRLPDEVWKDLGAK